MNTFTAKPSGFEVECEIIDDKWGMLRLRMLSIDCADLWIESALVEHMSQAMRKPGSLVRIQFDVVEPAEQMPTRNGTCG